MSEFDLINQYFKSAAIEREDVSLGIGDDCAMLSPPLGKQLAISTDTLICGVHFPKNTSAYDIGYKSLAVNLSDLAAMGAEPAWVSLALSLPDVNHSWLADFMAGFNVLAKHYNISLIGGDTTQGPLSITINIVGFVNPLHALKRSNAKIGEHIFVTGTLGDGAAGLKLILNETNNKPHADYLINRLNRPTPAVEAGELLLGLASSAIDISDGLMADLAHICKASEVGAVIHLENLPLSASLIDYYNDDLDWSSIISGGDDYELCFTCAIEKVNELKLRMAEHDIKITKIGEITDSLELIFKLNNESIVFDKAGYDHF